MVYYYNKKMGYTDMIESKITIGLPVYNGEKTIRKSLQSIISQTFTDFVLIISDNGSTDTTQDICKEFVKHDKRILFFRQNKNMGGLWNFEYLLNSAKTEYFVWIAADDFWEPTFLEKNINILDTKKDVVASIGKTTITGDYYNKFNYDQNDSAISKFYKKYRQHFLSFKYYGTNAITYKDRVKTCIKASRYAMFVYSVFRTEILKKLFAYSDTHWDKLLILRSLRYGNLHVIDEVLYNRALGGISNINFVDRCLHKDIKLGRLLFPNFSLTKWFIKNLGIVFFLKNIIFFIRLNSSSLISIPLDLIKYLKSDKKKEYYFDNS